MWGKREVRSGRREGKKGGREGRKEYCDIISHFPNFLSVTVGTENKLTHSDI